MWLQFLRNVRKVMEIKHNARPRITRVVQITRHIEVFYDEGDMWLFLRGLKYGALVGSVFGGIIGWSSSKKKLMDKRKYGI